MVTDHLDEPTEDCVLQRGVCGDQRRACGGREDGARRLEPPYRPRQVQRQWPVPVRHQHQPRQGQKRLPAGPRWVVESSRATV